MASGKETPRQRMVGMMYLVLTALLALQVSSAMIFKFQALNESLERSTNETGSWNQKKLAKIADEIKTRGNKSNEVALLQSVTQVCKESSNTIKYIENLKNELIKEAGGYDEDGSLKGAKEETKVEVVMLGANKNGKAYELKKKLDEFTKFMNEKSGMKISSMAPDGKDDPLFKDNEEQRNKDFAELNFGQTPLVAALAILSEFQSRITTMEATTLAMAAENVGIKDFKFDVLKPMVSPASRVVAAGTKYEAKLFMTATSSTLKPVMEIGSSPVIVDEHGVGSIAFTAAGGGYGENGLAKKVWTGKITMKMPDGKDTTYLVSEEYYVAEPVIKVESDAVKTLYKNCGNKLNIQVPALGNNYNPTFSVQGASVIPGRDKGLITVVPTGAIPTVSLKVNNNGSYIGEEKFKVKLIPLPTFELRANGALINPIPGVESKALRTITIKVIPDKEFEKALPEEAIYAITKLKIRNSRNRTGLSPREFSSGTIKVGSDWDLRQNDRLVIEVLEVKRKNFRGEWEVVKMPEASSVFQIPLN